MEWVYKDENAIIDKVDILWSNHGENTRNVIEKGVPNNEYYVWNIPETFTNYKQPVILWPQDGSINVYRNPIIRILPDVTTNEITDSSFIIIDSGYFISPIPDASFNVVLEMRDTLNRVVYSGDASISFSLLGNKINTVTVPDPIIFPGNLDPKKIDIYVANSVTTYNDALVGTNEPQSFDVIRNVTIV